MGLLIGVFGILSSSVCLWLFFLDYKNEKYWMASFELVSSIILISCCVCAMCHWTLQVIT